MGSVEVKTQFDCFRGWEVLKNASDREKYQKNADCYVLGDCLDQPDGSLVSVFELVSDNMFIGKALHKELFTGSANIGGVSVSFENCEVEMTPILVCSEDTINNILLDPNDVQSDWDKSQMQKALGCVPKHTGGMA